MYVNHFIHKHGTWSKMNFSVLRGTRPKRWRLCAPIYLPVKTAGLLLADRSWHTYIKMNAMLARNEGNFTNIIASRPNKHYEIKTHSRLSRIRSKQVILSAYTLDTHTHTRKQTTTTP